MEEKRKESKGNPNGVIYAVTMKAAIEIIVGNMTDFGRLFSVSALEQYNCVCGHRLGASVSRSAKRRLESLCTLQHSWEKLRIETKVGSSKNKGPYICPERLAHVRCRVRAGIILGNKRLQAWSVLFT